MACYLQYISLDKEELHLTQTNLHDWKNHIRQVIQQNQIHTVRVSLHDNSNIQRARYVPVRYFLESVMQNDLTFPSVVFSMDTSAAIELKAGNGFEGGYPSWKLKPDLSTFGVLPYSPGIARVIADIYSENGEPLSYSPRHVLKNVLKEYEKLGLRVYGAFEYEFYVFKEPGTPLQPVWEGLQCFSEIKQSEVEEILTSIMLALSEMGAGPEVANTEYGSGQFEVTNSPFWGVEIADMAFFYRTSIKEILAKKGYSATFMSKPLVNMSGSGAHMNHSLFDTEGNNLFYDSTSANGLSELCLNFIGGQLYHAKALAALCNPTINSYKRLQPYSFAPNTTSWGYEHRSAMIRVPGARREHTRLENRLPGSDTNPYTTLAALLAAGLDGIKNKIQPPGPLQNVDAYASNLEKLPNSLPEALVELEKDEWFATILGKEFISHYTTLRKSEWNRFLKAVTDWELKEYLPLF